MPKFLNEVRTAKKSSDEINPLTLTKEYSMPQSIAHLHGKIAAENAEEKLHEKYCSAVEYCASKQEFDLPQVGTFWNDTVLGVTYEIIALAYDKDESKANAALDGRAADARYGDDHEHRNRDSTYQRVRIIARTRNGVVHAMTPEHFGTYEDEFSHIENTEERIDRFVEVVPPVETKWHYKYTKPLIDFLARRRPSGDVVPMSNVEAILALDGKTPGPLWVLNTTRVNGKLPQFILEGKSATDTGSSIVTIHATWLPQDITSGPLSRETLSQLASFRKLVSMGHVKLISQQQADLIMCTKEAKEESTRVKNWTNFVRQTGGASRVDN